MTGSLHGSRQTLHIRPQFQPVFGGSILGDAEALQAFIGLLHASRRIFGEPLPVLDEFMENRLKAIHAPAGFFPVFTGFFPVFAGFFPVFAGFFPVFAGFFSHFPHFLAEFPGFLDIRLHFGGEAVYQMQRALVTFVEVFGHSHIIWGITKL